MRIRRKAQPIRRGTDAASGLDGDSTVMDNGATDRPDPATVRGVEAPMVISPARLARLLADVARHLRPKRSRDD
jgi:hypothetical protein